MYRQELLHGKTDFHRQPDSGDLEAGEPEPDLCRGRGTISATLLQVAGQVRGMDAIADGPARELEGVEPAAPENVRRGAG